MCAKEEKLFIVILFIIILKSIIILIPIIIYYCNSSVWSLLLLLWGDLLSNSEQHKYQSMRDHDLRHRQHIIYNLASDNITNVCTLYLGIDIAFRNPKLRFLRQRLQLQAAGKYYIEESERYI